MEYSPPYKGKVPLATELLLDSIAYKVVNQGRNLLFLFVGDIGTGKSWGAVNFARLFDPWFDPNTKIVYEPAEFFDALDRVEHRGEVIVWDEAGVGMPAREWNSLFNRVVSKTLQIFREATPGRIVLIFATPRKFFVDKTARVMLNMEWRFRWERGEPHPYATPYELHYVIHYKTKTMEDYTVYRLPAVRYRNMLIKIKKVYMAALPPELAEVYRKKSVPRKHMLRFQYALIRALGEDFPSDVSNWLYRTIVGYGIDDFLSLILSGEETLTRFGASMSQFNLFTEALRYVVERRGTSADKTYLTEFLNYFEGSNPKAEIKKQRFVRYVLEWLTKTKEEVVPNV